MSSPPNNTLRPHHICNLSYILCRANIHYRRVAARIRASIRPTHYARKQAERLGLTVDIPTALGCDPKYVGVVPLPILDVSATSMTMVMPSFRCNATPSPTVEVVRKQAQALTILDVKPPIKGRSSLKCIIPGAIILPIRNQTATAVTINSSASACSVAPLLPSTSLKFSQLPSQHLVQENGRLVRLNTTLEECSSTHPPTGPGMGRRQCIDFSFDGAERERGSGGPLDVNPSSIGTSPNATSTYSIKSATADEGALSVTRIKRKSVEVSGSIVGDFEKRRKIA